MYPIPQPVPARKASRYQAFAIAGMALTVIATLVLSACSEPKAGEAPQAAGGPPVTAAVVIEKMITETQEFSGRIEAVDQVEIRPRVSGFVAEVHVKPGTLVKKGEVLFVIDQRPYQAEANRAEAAALAARAKAELAKTEYARAEKLLADKAISQRDADERAANFKELDAAARAAAAANDAAQINLGFTRVTAPISGRVSKAEITTGNLVDANAVLTSIVSYDPVYASFDGDEDAFLRVGAAVRQGHSAKVKIGLANEAGFPHEGKLEFVDNRLDPATGSVRMRAVFKNADAALAPGLFARVQLSAPGKDGQGEQNAVLIADRAVGTDQNRKFVFVVGKDGKAEYRPVRLGPVIDGLRVVRDGLKAGEKIVVNGLQRVRPGAPITAETVQMDVARVNSPAGTTAGAKATASK